MLSLLLALQEWKDSTGQRLLLASTTSAPPPAGAAALPLATASPPAASPNRCVRSVEPAIPSRRSAPLAGTEEEEKEEEEHEVALVSVLVLMMVEEVSVGGCVYARVRAWVVEVEGRLDLHSHARRPPHLVPPKRVV